MELQCPSLPFLTSAVLFFLFILMKKVASSKPEGNIRLPPGPRKLPIIGNLHQLLGEVPHRLLRDLAQKHGPDLMHLRLGQIDHIIISSAEGAKEIMKTHDLKFCSRPTMMASTVGFYNNLDIAFAPYGSYWRQMRKICSLELLSSRRVKASFSIRKEEVLNLVRDISAATNSTVNLTEKLESFVNATISRTAFGAKCKHGERFIAAAKKGIELASGFNLADLFPSVPFIDTLSGLSSKLIKCHKEIDEILDQIVEEHCSKRGANATSQEDEKLEEDLVDVLLSVQEKGNLEFPLTKTNIKAVIFDMFIGGTETASTTLEWAMTELMRHPETMKKVQSEVRGVLKGKEKIEEEDLSHLHFVKLVIKETLRLHMPVPLLLPRVSSEPCTVMGYDIPPGSKVLINGWAVGRDPRYWEDGESFRPERFDGSSIDFIGGSFEFVPFGAGRRMCPGMTFGMATMELLLSLLLFYFDWELPVGMKPEDLDMTECFGATAGRKTHLCLLAKPHPLLPVF